MTESAPSTIYLRDYLPPAWLVDEVSLDIDLHDTFTEVRAEMHVRRNPERAEAGLPLVLDGNELEHLETAVDGRVLAANDYQLDDETLTLSTLPDACLVTTRVRIKPEENTQLEGLYASKTGYFTQCEAQGFRRITWFPDRPDVMARYTTTIHADRKRFPLLLCNGNLEASGDDGDGRHWARWNDPFPKPSYLFAMVAANLDKLEAPFTTASGREVLLQIYVEPGKLDQSGFALEALKSSMRWDEETFGLELDLDQYMIVAVGDFNMGAMENKGLNIFNTKYVLARPDTATDSDFMMLDRVVAHEYFHNWTGNRVTCRDWFQLSLKEGLTVFRDQQYGGDRYSHAVQRIQEVRQLRAAQFPEDAGPMAHPIRPESYIEISNFYTATVYEKGAEVVRMIHTLLGEEKFRAGMDLYFERHDGQAVRTEEFVAAMQDASGIDLSQFRRWYGQAGTPVVRASGRYDGERKTYSLTLRQHTPPTPDQSDKQALHIPVATALIDSSGADLPLRLAGDDGAAATTRILSLIEPEQTFTFEDVPELPAPSLFRGFSAPVILEQDLSDHDLAHLAAHDSDPFNRWEAGQRLAVNVLLEAIATLRQGGEGGAEPHYGDALVDVFARTLEHADADPAFAAEALSLPAAGYLAEQMDVVDADAILSARTALRRHLAAALEADFADAYLRFDTPGPYSPEPAPAGRRALRNIALGYLMELETPAIRQRCLDQLTTADNMTNAMAALVALANSSGEERGEALAWFYDQWRDEPLVLDKWFSVQATSRLPGTLDDVQRLLQHPDFSLRNPNRVRSLIGAFCHANHVRFHAADGSGYRFCAEQVRALDPLNAQVAARLARAFDRWRKFDQTHQAHAQAALESIRDVDGLSKDTFEVVTRALATDG